MWVTCNIVYLRDKNSGPSIILIESIENLFSELVKFKWTAQRGQWMQWDVARERAWHVYMVNKNCVHSTYAWLPHIMDKYFSLFTELERVRFSTSGCRSSVVLPGICWQLCIGRWKIWSHAFKSSKRYRTRIGVSNQYKLIFFIFLFISLWK